ncbi:MAG: hypothetical protein ACOYCB_13960, partial [Fastidiosipilaceae bacterium]
DEAIEIGTIPHLETGIHKFIDNYLEKDKYYYYKIYCIDNSNMISDSALTLPTIGTKQAVDKVPPDKPIINLEQAKIGAITIGWNAVANATKYKIRRYESNGVDYNLLGVTYSLQWTDNSLNMLESSTYRYTVTALDDWDNESYESELSNAITSLTPWMANDTLPPNDDSITITPIANSDGTITITWSGFTDDKSKISGYNIWRAEDARGKNAFIVGTVSSANINTFTDITTKHNIIYYYWVTCFDNTGNETEFPDFVLDGSQMVDESRQLDEAYQFDDTEGIELFLEYVLGINTTNPNGWKEITAKNTNNPTFLEGSKIDAIARLGRVDITWTKSDSNDVAYYVVEKLENGVDWIVLEEVNTNSYTEYNIYVDKTVVANWKYRVKAVDIVGLSSEYITVSSTVVTNYNPADGSAPSTPNTPTASSFYDGSITVTWTHTSPPQDLAKYRIYRNMATSFGLIAEVDKNTLTYIDTGLENGKKYSYKISAIDYSGMESNLTNSSTEVEATDKIAPTPPNPSATGSLGAITVTWTEVAEKNVIYEIWRCEGATWLDGSAMKIATVAGGNNGAGYFIDYDPPVNQIKVYTYKLKAIDAWGNVSSFSTNSATGISTTNFNGLVGGKPASDIVDFISDISSDAKLTQSERIEIKEKIIKIAGTVPPPLLVNLTSGECKSIRDEALAVGIKSSNAVYVNLGTAYTNLQNYLSSFSSITPWDTSNSNSIAIVVNDWNTAWQNYYTAYFALRQEITDYTSKSSVTIIVADGSTSKNIKQANYIVPVGSTSAQETINTAISALPVNGGKIVLLDGTYIVDGNINVPSNVIIEGQGNGTIVQTHTILSSDIKIFNIANKSNVLIQNLKIIGNKYTGVTYKNYGIYNDQSDNCTISQITFYEKFAGVAMSVQNISSNNIKIKNCYFYKNGINCNSISDSEIINN